MFTKNFELVFSNHFIKEEQLIKTDSTKRYVYVIYIIM